MVKKALMGTEPRGFKEVKGPRAGAERAWDMEVEVQGGGRQFCEGSEEESTPLALRPQVRPMWRGAELLCTLFVAITKPDYQAS